MQNKKKPKPSKNGAREIAPEQKAMEMPHAFLIRIPKRADRERAIAAFLHVPKTRCRFKDNRFLVTHDHIEALKKAGIPFEDITEPN